MALQEHLPQGNQGQGWFACVETPARPQPQPQEKPEYHIKFQNYSINPPYQYEHRFQFYSTPFKNQNIDCPRVSDYIARAMEFMMGFVPTVQR